MFRDPLHDDAVYTSFNIEIIKNDLKSNNVNKQVKAPLTPKHGKDCVTRVLYTYQQQSLGPLQRYVFQIVQCTVGW